MHSAMLYVFGCVINRSIDQPRDMHSAMRPNYNLTRAPTSNNKLTNKSISQPISAQGAKNPGCTTTNWQSKASYPKAQIRNFLTISKSWSKFEDTHSHARLAPR